MLIKAIKMSNILRQVNLVKSHVSTQLFSLRQTLISNEWYILLLRPCVSISQTE